MSKPCPLCSSMEHVVCCTMCEGTGAVEELPETWLCGHPGCRELPLPGGWLCPAHGCTACGEAIHALYEAERLCKQCGDRRRIN